jgi:DNA-binding NtrC family response regulator
MKTLIIDNLNTLECYREFFEDSECNINLISDPKKAIKEIRSKNKYNRIISEIIFKNCNINGFEILSAARNCGITDRIILTSISNPIPIDRNLVSLFIRKPLSKTKLKILALDSLKKYKNMFVVNHVPKYIINNLHSMPI